MARVFGLSCNMVGRYMNAAHMSRIAPLRNNAVRAFSVTASPCIQAGKQGEEHDIGSWHNTSEMDKRILVKAKMYPDIESTPDSVPVKKMTKARDEMRIRTNIWMLVGTGIVCLCGVIWGKYLRRHGVTIEKLEMAHANELREEHFQHAQEEAKKH